MRGVGEPQAICDPITRLLIRGQAIVGGPDDPAGHEEEDASAWGHAHAPDPEELAGPGGWRRGFSAVVAVGARPCSGAIIVLVFALALIGLAAATPSGAVSTATTPHRTPRSLSRD